MAVITRPRNKETHPGIVDLPEKRGREESKVEGSGQSEPWGQNSGSLKPRKPPKRQKSAAEEEKCLYKLAKLQNTLTKAVLKEAAEAARPPGPQTAKIPQKLSAEAAKKLFEGKRDHGK